MINDYFYQFQEWIIIILSFLSLISFLGRAYFEKQWVCITKAVPRFLFMSAFLSFKFFFQDLPITDPRALVVGYCLAYLLSSDILYNGGVLWKEFKTFKLGDNGHD